MKGKVLAGYSLLEKVESNDRETTYIASARDGDGLVVIHVLSAQERKTEGLQVLRELRQLKNPNILSVIDCGETPWGTLYYVEPFHEGVSLRSFLESSGTILWVSAAVLLYEVARAISYCHGRGIAHRELTQDNIILDPGGSVRVKGVGVSALYKPTTHHDFEALKKDIVGLGRLAASLVGADVGEPIEISLDYRELMERAQSGQATAMDVEALLARMLKYGGLSDSDTKLTEFFEEWSFFFLLNKTFVPSSDADFGGDEPSEEPELRLAPADESTTTLDLEFFEEQSSSSREVKEEWALDSDEESEQNHITDTMELERDQIVASPVMAPPTQLEDLGPSHDALDRLGELHETSAKNRQKVLSLLVIAGAIVLAVFVAKIVVTPPSESELEERAKEELSREFGEPSAKKEFVEESTTEELAKKELALLVTSLRADLSNGRVSQARERVSALDKQIQEEDDLVVFQGDLIRVEETPAKAEAFLVGKWEEKKKSVVLTLALLGLYQREKRYDDAAALIELVDGQGMSSPEFYLASAILFREMGDLKQELRMLQQEVTIRPESAQRFRKGLLQEHFLLFREAGETYREIVMSAPTEDDGPFVGLLRVVEERDFDPRGYEEVKSILKVFPHHLQSQLYLAERHFSRGEYRDAAKYLEAYEKKRPESWESQLLRAGLALRTGNKEGAISLYERLRSQRPKDAVVAHNLSIAYRANGNTSRAKTLLEEATQLDKGLWQSHCELAQIQHRARRYSAAKKLYRRAYEGYKQHSWLREILGLKLDSPKAGYLLEEMCYAPEIIESSRYDLNKKSVIR